MTKWFNHVMFCSLLPERSLSNDDAVDQPYTVPTSVYSYLIVQDSLSSGESDLSGEVSASNPPSPKVNSINASGDTSMSAYRDSPMNLTDHDRDVDQPALVVDMDKESPRNSPLNLNGHGGADLAPAGNDGREFASENGRKRRASDEGSIESSTKASDLGGIEDGLRDEDDDDDGDEDDKLQSKDYDPERLKAFNMFVRLFVDENLDRVVPISKQPKDKIQAILDACNRQFPDFHERSRKRIRTYLKSCRRLRRSKDQNGWDQRVQRRSPHQMHYNAGRFDKQYGFYDNAPMAKLRPTPPHLTSAAAEGYLAQACDNETQNAKRMRMGLEPLSAAAMPLSSTSSSSTSSATVGGQEHCQSSPASHAAAILAANQPSTPSTQPSLIPSDYVRAHAAAAAAAAVTPTHAAVNFRPPPELPAPYFTNGNAALFRPAPNFSPAVPYQHPAHHHASVLHPVSQIATQNGPADLSVRKNAKKPLSAAEVTTIRSLIAGYRESAAFLYRSADELEQLLQQQN